MWTKLVCLVALFYLSDCVTVKVGNYNFPLEAVKEYKAIVDKSHAVADHPTHQTEALICHNKNLPSAFKELCQAEDTEQATLTFGELNRICGSMDECEVCANAACTGCW